MFNNQANGQQSQFILNQSSSKFKEEDDSLSSSIRQYHQKNEFLYKWFENFHKANVGGVGAFNRDLLFNDHYLSLVLHKAIPSEFEQTEINNSSVSFQQDPLQTKKEDSSVELKLFTSLKLFYKERQLGLGDVLKSIRHKKQASKRLDFASWEKAYWQLVHIIFTAFYLESKHNDVLNEYFDSLVKENFLSLKIVLEIVSSVLRRCQSTQTDVVVSKNTCTPNQMLLDQETQQLRPHQTQKAEMNQDDHYIVQVSDLDYLHKLTESSEGSVGTEGDEEDLLEEDTSGWDVFDDFHKFQKREQKIKERKRKLAQEELQYIQQQKQEEIEVEQSRNLETEIVKLENKLRAHKETIMKKNSREASLQNEINLFHNKMQAKEQEVESLNNRMVLFETVRHKYDTKKREAEVLLQRVEELSQLNGGLTDQVLLKQLKTQKLAKELEELKEKLKLLKSDRSGSKDQGSSSEEPSNQIYNQDMAHKRIDSSLMAPETLRQVKEMAAQENRSELRRNNTLQDELNFEEPSPEKQGTALQLSFKTKPTLDEEEIFEGSSTFRSQYRFESTQDELVAPSEHDVSVSDERDPEYMDVDLLRQEFSREKQEKAMYRKMYLELQERSYHFQKMMEEYERLYTEFLTRSIQAQKEKAELQLKLKRVNCLSQSISSVSCSNQSFRKLKCFLNQQRLLALLALITMIIVVFMII